MEYRQVGTHRRIRWEQLMAYQRKAEADRQAALAEFIAYHEELGIGAGGLRSPPSTTRMSCILRQCAIC
jgi:hypothetical protein